MKLLLENLLFTLLVPGSVAVYVPLWLARDREPAAGAVLLAAGLLLACGAAIYGSTVWDFAHVGRGTPAPIDAPKRLVARGLYRYGRNPMYVGVLTLILGQALLWRAPGLLLYGLVVAACFHAFVRGYEEPHLARVFGSEYEAYRARIPRWLPTPTILAQGFNRDLAPWITAVGLTPRSVTLEVRGRHSGRPLRLSMSPSELDGRAYLVSLAGERAWVRNVRAARGEAVIVHGRRQRVHLREIAPEERAPVLLAYVQRRAFTRGRKRAARLYFGLEVPTIEAMEQQAAQFPVFVIEPESGLDHFDQRELQVASRLGATPETLWEHATSPKGVNRELWPLLRMTFPPDTASITLGWAPGQRLFRSWLLLAGFLPVEYDDLAFAEVWPGRGFLERSRLLSQRSWEHERVIDALPGGSRVTDRVRFLPKLALLGALHGFVFALVFRLRHRNLRRTFGSVGTAAGPGEP